MGDTLSAVRQSPLLTNLLQFEIKKNVILTNRNNPVYMEPVTSNDSIEVKICCTKGNFSSLGLFMQD